MNRSLLSRLWLAAFLLLGLAVAPACGQAPPPSVLFAGVNVVPMDSERVLENQDVLVTEGRIVSIAPAGTSRVPAETQRIDGTGRWLMPGLAEMHGHVPNPGAGEAEDMLFLYVANGVTTVRNMAGQEGHPALRDRIARGELLGPTLHVASPWLSAEAAPTAEAAREAVRRYREAGFDLIKIGSLGLDPYRAMAEEAHRISLPFAGHIPAEVGLIGALEARQASIDHLDRYVEFLVPENRRPEGREAGFFGSGWIEAVDESRIDEAVARTLAAGTWNVPTLSLVEHLASAETIEAMLERPEMRYMPRRILDGWANTARQIRSGETFTPEAARALVELRRRLVAALDAAGAPIALGSDAPQFFNVPGFSIHHEMRMMEAAGLSRFEVLAAGTREPARYFGMPDAFGTVAPGRRADLILLEANPLEDLANVRRRVGVMVRGRWLPEEQIQGRLESIAAGIRAGEPRE